MRVEAAASGLPILTASGPIYGNARPFPGRSETGVVVYESSCVLSDRARPQARARWRFLHHALTPSVARSAQAQMAMPGRAAEPDCRQIFACAWRFTASASGRIVGGEEGGFNAPPQAFSRMALFENAPDPSGELTMKRLGYLFAAGLLLAQPAAAHTPQQPPHQ